MHVIIIVALTRDLAIGRRGTQPYFIKADLRRFRELTTGHTVIMGRKTFEALPKGALPHRRNIVVSRNAAYDAPGAEVATSLPQAIDMARSAGETEAYIIGGAQIYNQALPWCDELRVTHIDADCPDADTHFRIEHPEQWQLAPDSDTLWRDDADGSPRYRFAHYVTSNPD